MKPTTLSFLNSTILTWALIASSALSANANATSVLIEKTDGYLVSEILPTDACPMHLISIFPAYMNKPDVHHFVQPREGVVMTPAKDSVVSWTLTRPDGAVIQAGLLKGQQWGREALEQVSPYKANLEFWSAKPELVQIYPDLTKSCTGFLASPGMRVVGIDASQIRSVKFFDDDNEAANVIENIRAGQVAAARKLETQAAAWRKKLERGVDTHCGMVVEINKPLVKVQTMIGEKWFKSAQLYPANTKSCRFVNGVYEG